MTKTVVDRYQPLVHIFQVSTEIFCLFRWARVVFSWNLGDHVLCAYFHEDPEQLTVYFIDIALNLSLCQQLLIDISLFIRNCAILRKQNGCQLIQNSLQREKLLAKVIKTASAETFTECICKAICWLSELRKLALCHRDHQLSCKRTQQINSY